MMTDAVEVKCVELNLVNGYPDRTPNDSIHNSIEDSIRDANTNADANSDTNQLENIFSCNQIIDRTLVVLTFWLTTALIMISYFAIQLANSQTWSGEIEARSWWQVPPLQALFFIATLCSASELTLRFARVNHDVDLRSQEILAGLFLVCVVLFIAAPKFVFEQIKPAAQNGTYKTGNCTDLYDLSAGDQEAMREACPTFDFTDAYVQLPKNLTSLLTANGRDSTTRSALVGITATNLGRVWQALPVLFAIMQRYVDQNVENSLLLFNNHLMKDPCFYRAMPLFCEVGFLRCTHSECQASEENGQSCVVNNALDDWTQCAVTECGQSCAVLTQKQRRKSLSQLLQHVSKELFKLSDSLEEYGMTLVEIDMIMFVFESATKASSESNYANTSSKTKTSMEIIDGCSELWRRNETVDTIDTQESISVVGCNPTERFFEKNAADIRTTYDSGNIFGFVFVSLSIFVGVAGKHRPIFAFASERDKRARFISLTLGIVAAVFIFLGGQNYENASLDPKFYPATVINLQFWVVVYFSVSWFCMHHAIFLLVVNSSQSTSKSGTKFQNRNIKKEGSMRKLTDAKKTMCSLRRKIFSSSGKYNVVYLFLREAVENIVQLVGILNTARVADVTAVSNRALLLSLNLIVLPLVVLVADAKWGPLVARSILIAVESLFDKAFIVLGVLLQSGSNVNASWLSQLLENLPSLLPAFMFCISSRTSIMALASMQDTKERKSKLKKATINWRASAKNDSSIIDSTATSSFNLESKQNKSFQELAQTVKHTVIGDRERVIFTLAGIVSFVLGVALLTHVEISIENQAQKCEAAVGALARCLLPRIYFRDNGLFGKTGCFFENSTVANCSGGRLLENNGIPVQILPEAPDIYMNMTKLEIIDVSGSKLTHLPESWSRVPYLTRIIAAECQSLHILPLPLCFVKTMFPSGGLNVQGTPCSKALNWSTQLLNMEESHQMDITEACVEALSDTLESLDMSHNNISHQDFQSKQLDWIQRLQKMFHLDLSHNNIDALDSFTFTLTRNVDANSVEHIDMKSGVNFGGNPISKFSVQGEAAERVIRILRSLGDVENCASLLTEIRIRGSNGNFSAVLEQLRQSCFSASLQLLMFEANSGFTLLQRGMFQGLTGLTWLDISANKLTSIANGTFSNLKDLKVLRIYDNQLCLCSEIDNKCEVVQKCPEKCNEHDICRCCKESARKHLSKSWGVPAGVYIKW